jgi:hypothetical protein
LPIDLPWLLPALTWMLKPFCEPKPKVTPPPSERPELLPAVAAVFP